MLRSEILNDFHLLNYFTYFDIVRMPIARSEKVKSLYDSCVNCVINHITYFIRPQQNQEKMIEIREKHNLLLQLRK